MAHVELGTAYDVQKSTVSQLYPMTKSAINDALEKVKNMVAKTKNQYYMLLCREKADYTIFNIGTHNVTAYDRLAMELKTCMKSRGKAKVIDSNDEITQIWLQDGDEVSLYYFFPANDNTIECWEGGL